MSGKQEATMGRGADGTPYQALKDSEHPSHSWPWPKFEHDDSSRKQKSAEGGAGGNRRLAISEHSTLSRPSPNPQRGIPPSPWYWSVLFHNNVHETQSPIDRKEAYGSIAAPPSSERPKKKWQLIRERVLSADFFLKNSAFDGQNGKESLHWSDLVNDSYEFRLQECFIIFVALLAVGVIGYSFLFERWSIVDSLYFTVVMLTTTGYGDITPTTAGGKIFASLFALAGIVLLGLVLGVVGSNLVEAEVEYSQKLQSASSSVLERAFGKRSSGKHGGAEDTEYDSDSDSVCSGENGEEARGRRRLSSIHGRYEETTRPSSILRHLPCFAPLLLGGLLMALIDHWKWYDTIYFSIVTATVR